MEKKPTRSPVSMPIPAAILVELRKRKKERGVVQQRTLEDALAFAFSEQGKVCWYWK